MVTKIFVTLLFKAEYCNKAKMNIIVNLKLLFIQNKCKKINKLNIIVMER